MSDVAVDSALPRRRPDQKIADWIFTSIKDEIVAGRIRANEILVEGTVAERFGVSRGPAREALQRLRRTSLVHALPRVGYLVAGVSLRDFDEVFQIRLNLEPLATELTAGRVQRGQASMSRLRALAAAVGDIDSAETDRGALVAELNHDFHLEVAAQSGNQRLVQIVGPLLDDINRVMRVLAYDEKAFAELADDHPCLVECMQNGLPHEAAALMRTQLEQSYELMRSFAIGTGIDLSP